MDLYAENILDHYHHPRHRGIPASANVRHSEINHSCGDAVTLGLTIEGGCIGAIGWEGEGCAISQAGMSILSEHVLSKSVDAVLHFSPDDMLAHLGVPVGLRRMKCAMLGLHTLKNALHIAQGEEPLSWVATIGERS